MKSAHRMTSISIAVLAAAIMMFGVATGGVCDQNGAVTIAKSFATIPFAITSWP